MKAQAIVSDIVLNVRRGKRSFTFRELYEMREGSQRTEVTGRMFETALKLVVLTGEVLCSMPPGSDLMEVAFYTPGGEL